MPAPNRLTQNRFASCALRAGSVIWLRPSSVNASVVVSATCVSDIAGSYRNFVAPFYCATPPWTIALQSAERGQGGAVSLYFGNAACFNASEDARRDIQCLPR